MLDNPNKVIDSPVVDQAECTIKTVNSIRQSCEEIEIKVGMSTRSLIDGWRGYAGQG